MLPSPGLVPAPRWSWSPGYMNNIDYLESLSNHNIICKECCNTTHYPPLPPSQPAHLVNINISLLGLAHSSQLTVPVLLSMFLTDLTITLSILTTSSWESRPGKSLRNVTKLRNAACKLCWVKYKYLQPGLCHTWSVQECGLAAIIRENFKLFGSAGWQRVPTVLRLALWSSVMSSLETKECRQGREKSREARQPAVIMERKEWLPAQVINSINNTNTDFRIISPQHLYSILIRGFLVLIGLITMFSNIASIIVSWKVSSLLWVSRRFSDSRLVALLTPDSPVLTESVGRWLRVTGAAGYKKVCCQYFLTKSQCETAQLDPGLAPLTRRKPILGSRSLSLSLSVSTVQPSQTPGMSQTCAGGGEKQRGRCQLFVGAESTPELAGWLWYKSSLWCRAMPAWCGPGNCSPNDFLWNAVTECHTEHTG